ncbi:unnamed protein product [Taenia asiatica]|uniref:DUF1713 domain-containing protein n=1 Tax=Taenia asiatica TaxID=60517 RepID=A0A0R3VU13_TAEAS|nr:unnamed protein product [Taenia asiatica]
MEKLGWSKQMSEGTLAPVIGRFKATYEGALPSTTPPITDFFPRVGTQTKVLFDCVGTTAFENFDEQHVGLSVGSVTLLTSSRLAQATNRLRYANEFRDLPALDTDWSADAETSDEGAKPSTSTSRRRKSNEKSNKKTRKRKKRK